MSIIAAPLMTKLLYANYKSTGRPIWLIRSSGSSTLQNQRIYISLYSRSFYSHASSRHIIAKGSRYTSLLDTQFDSVAQNL